MEHLSGLFNLFLTPRAQNDQVIIFKFRPLLDRQRPRLVIALYWVFSGSTLVRFVAEVSIGISHNANLGLIGLLMAFTQVVSVILLIYLLWERIRPTGSQIREAKGERF